MSSTSNLPATATIDETRSPYDEPVSKGMLGRWTNHVVKRAASEAVRYVEAEIERRDGARQHLEDIRANHRNLNRFMTLLGALLIGLTVTFILTHDGIPGVYTLPSGVAKTLGPYTFVITVMLDSSLAAYAFIRKY